MTVTKIRTAIESLSYRPRPLPGYRFSTMMEPVQTLERSVDSTPSEATTMMEPVQTLERSVDSTQRDDVIEQLKGIRTSIDAQKKPSEATYLINQDGPTHVKMRLLDVLFSVDNAGAVAITLTIGAKSFVYNVIGPLTLVVPPPVTIVDRGIDVAAVAGAGNVDLAQFRYTAE